MTKLHINELDQLQLDKLEKSVSSRLEFIKYECSEFIQLCLKSWVKESVVKEGGDKLSLVELDKLLNNMQTKEQANGIIDWFLGEHLYFLFNTLRDYFIGQIDIEGYSGAKQRADNVTLH